MGTLQRGRHGIALLDAYGERVTALQVVGE